MSERPDLEAVLAYTPEGNDPSRGFWRGMQTAARYAIAQEQRAETLAAEVARLRRRTHEIQEAADKRYGKLERQQRWTRDLFRRAREAWEHNQRDEDGTLRYLNASAWDQAAWTIEFTMGEQEALAAENARLERIANAAHRYLSLQGTGTVGEGAALILLREALAANPQAAPAPAERGER